MQVSVVIGSYNQKERLEKVLEGFQKQDFNQEYEVVVVDSMSPDGTKDMVDMLQSKELSFELQFIQRENPAGKAEARNVGVSHAKGEYIIITDADMIPDEGFVKAHGLDAVVQFWQYLLQQDDQNIECECHQLPLPL